jgi:hypothetical protein
MWLIKMKIYARADIQLHEFLTSEVDGGEWPASHPGRFIQKEKDPDTH